MQLLNLRCCRCSRLLLKPLSVLSNSATIRYKSTKNYYEVLGVAQNATQEQIKSAFLELSKKVHPDQNPDASSHEKFVAINEAYMVLGKAASRRDYDMQMRYSAHPFFTEGPHDTHGPYDHTRPYGYGQYDDIPYWKKDPFSDHGYEYEQMRREREWKDNWFHGRHETSDPEQHPYAVWVRLPIGLFYIAFIWLILSTYRRHPEKFKSRATREREFVIAREEASLRRAAEADKLESIDNKNDIEIEHR